VSPLALGRSSIEMRIVVPIKQVPETNAVKMDEETGTMIREGVEAIVNPLDLYAIELAIRLRDSHAPGPPRKARGGHAEDGGGEVICISMGPPKAETALREAIAMGADSGVLVSDKVFAASDTWATSYVLAGAVRRIGDFDLIVCGERATDGDTGQVGPGLAAFCDLPVATYVSGVDSVAEGSCRVRRLVEDGYEVLDMELPAVLTVVKEIAEPRLPTLRGKQRSRKVDIPVWTSDDLDVEVDEVGRTGSPTRVVKIFRPKVARECEKLPAESEHAIEAAAERVVEFLKQRELI